jgi:hypothetical protein
VKQGKGKEDEGLRKVNERQWWRIEKSCCDVHTVGKKEEQGGLIKVHDRHRHLQSYTAATELHDSHRVTRQPQGYMTLTEVHDAGRPAWVQPLGEIVSVLEDVLPALLDRVLPVAGTLGRGIGREVLGSPE